MCSSVNQILTSNQTKIYPQPTFEGACGKTMALGYEDVGEGRQEGRQYQLE
jgi:hypothetical protein